MTPGGLVAVNVQSIHDQHVPDASKNIARSNRSSSHTATERARRTRDLAGDSLTVRFSPQVRGALQELHAVVRKDRAFEGELADMLQDMAHGKPINVTNALIELTWIFETAAQLRRKDVNDALEATRLTLMYPTEEYPVMLSSRSSTTRHR